MKREITSILLASEAILPAPNELQKGWMDFQLCSSATGPPSNEKGQSTIEVFPDRQELWLSNQVSK